jgi:DNA-binding MarR family transcriptional regulator
MVLLPWLFFYISCYDIKDVPSRPREPSEKSDLASRDYAALASFRYHIRRFLNFSQEAARAEGLEPQQHQLLLAVRTLSPGSGPTIGDLAEHLLIRHHSAGGLIDRMAVQGLVERLRSSEDRREVRIGLTAKGLAMLHRLTAAHRDELQRLGPQLLESLTAVLHNAPLPEENVPET